MSVRDQPQVGKPESHADGPTLHIEGRGGRRLLKLLQTLHCLANGKPYCDATRYEIAELMEKKSEKTVARAERDGERRVMLSVEPIGQRYIADPYRRDSEQRDCETIYRYQIERSVADALAPASNCPMDAKSVRRGGHLSDAMDTSGAKVSDGPPRILFPPFEKEEEKEEEPPPPEPAPPFDPVEIDLPLSLDTPEFRDAWREWCAYRHELGQRKPRLGELTERAARMQIGKLERYGEEAAINAIEDAIINSWQGLHPKPIKPTNNKAAPHSGLQEFLFDDKN